MGKASSSRFSVCFGAAVLAVLLLGFTAEGMATPNMHVDGGGRETPWTNCTACHGADLTGGFVGVSCFDCHNDFSPPDPPPTGHHIPGRDNPQSNCTFCHGADLAGGIGPSCFTCHDDVWSGGGGGNSPPVVDHGGPYTGVPGQPIQFDASGTTDPDGDSLSYVWLSFGDGTPPQFPSLSPLFTHTYANPGTYTVKLSVTDTFNFPVVVETTATVGAANSPPTAAAGGPYFGFAGDPLQLDASGSSDPDGDTLSYSWDFGDGTLPTLFGPNPIASHAYAGAGTYTATVTVDDGVNTPVTADVTVDIVDPNLPPSVDPGGPYSGTPGQALQLDASGSSDLDGDLLTYSWDFGDGTLPTLPSPVPTASHAYAAAGTYFAEVTVDDGVNDPVSAVVEVEISELPPPPGGEVWDLLIPYLGAELTVEFEEFAGILLVHQTYPYGPPVFGIGMETDGVIFWMDMTGAIFFGNINHNAGTMRGIVFDYHGESSIWFAELF